MGRWDSIDRIPALQMQSPEVKPKSYQKIKNKREDSDGTGYLKEVNNCKSCCC
jgi:hypothetical protein